MPGDSIRVGPVKLLVSDGELETIDESKGLRLDAYHLNQVVAKGINLLQDISLSIEPHELVAVVGVSGAGKSTLLDALNGFRPARKGAVLVNETDLYRNLNTFRTELGYVPQEDIIHRELSPLQALDYAARLRLPADTSKAEREARVLDVLETLGVAERKDVPIARLSGGQRKRISIGVELLTAPGLFYLDEATSGLDPGTESQMMRLLRKLADHGHTIVLITHATKNVMLCDQVVFLAQGGHLAYYGPPDRALRHFGVEDFDAIYVKLEEEASPAEWSERYRSSSEYRTFVVDRLRSVADRAQPQSDAPVQPLAPGATVRRVSSASQFVTLSRRGLAILSRDRIALALMILTAPIIGAFDFLVWKKHDLIGSASTFSQQGRTDLFLAVLVCVLVGAVASMREIVKEADIYRRERMVTLKIGPYVMSKVWLGILLALYQAAIFLITKKVAADWPHTSTATIEAYVTFFLATSAGMLLGLFISAISANQNSTPLLLIVFLIPQFMFGGPLLPLNAGPGGKLIANITPTKWAYEALETVSGILPNKSVVSCWIPLIVIIMVLFLLIVLAQKRKDPAGLGFRRRR